MLELCNRNDLMRESWFRKTTGRKGGFFKKNNENGIFAADVPHRSFPAAKINRKLGRKCWLRLESRIIYIGIDKRGSIFFFGRCY
jgi:hypothetical protein